VLRRIHGSRISLRTGLIVIVLALVLWALVAYVNIRDFVPVEFTQPTGGR
jgi:hypothetical protein